MNLIIDIGNSMAKFVLFEGDEPRKFCYADNETLEGLNRFISDQKPARAILSTVTTLGNEARKRLALLPCPLMELNSKTPIPIQNGYHTPETLGTDRLSAVVGAYTLRPEENILVIDAGTCITYDLIDATGLYRGGNISPGLKMRFAALHQYTNRLPLVSENGEVPLVGFDTETALRSGVINGLHYEVSGYIENLKKSFKPLTLFLTGGDSRQLNQIFNNQFLNDPWLVARGLNRILEYNEK